MIKLPRPQLPRPKLPSGAFVSPPALARLQRLLWGGRWQQGFKLPPLPGGISLWITLLSLGFLLAARVLSAPPLAAADLDSLQVCSAVPLEQARAAGLDRDRLQAQLGRLGGTGWELAELELALPDGLFLQGRSRSPWRRWRQSPGRSPVGRWWCAEGSDGAETALRGLLHEQG